MIPKGKKQKVTEGMVYNHAKLFRHSGGIFMMLNDNGIL